MVRRQRIDNRLQGLGAAFQHSPSGSQPVVGEQQGVAAPVSSGPAHDEAGGSQSIDEVGGTRLREV